MCVCVCINTFMVEIQITWHQDKAKASPSGAKATVRRTTFWVVYIAITWTGKSLYRFDLSLRRSCVCLSPLRCRPHVITCFVWDNSNYLYQDVRSVFLFIYVDLVYIYGNIARKLNRLYSTPVANSYYRISHFFL